MDRDDQDFGGYAFELSTGPKLPAYSLYITALQLLMPDDGGSVSINIGKMIESICRCAHLLLVWNAMSQSKQMRFIFLLFVLQLIWSSTAHANADCAYESINKVADTLAIASPTDFQMIPNGEVQAALEKVQADEHALSCVRLLQRDSNLQRQKHGYEGQWSLIADDSNLSNRTLFDKCNSLAACKTSQTIVDLLSSFCSNQQKNSAMAINIAPGDCAKIKKTPWPLSPARRGIGWGLVAAGGVTMILGAIQMAVPLFSTDDGCVVAGLRHPCSADRFGVGGALLGSGLAVLGGGVLTLTLPARGN